MRNLLMLALAAGFLGACAQKSAYEAAVEDYEPVYCYQSLAGVTCYEKPNFRDERRLVNYFGPAPKRHERPAPPPKQKLFAPEPIAYWVKDPEPIPRPAPVGDLADRPWVGTDGRQVVSEAELLGARQADLDGGKGTQVLLRNVQENAQAQAADTKAR